MKSMQSAVAIGSNLFPNIAARLLAASVLKGRGPRTIDPAQLTWEGLREERVSVNGASVCAYVWGDTQREPLVLLAHGWSGWGLQMRHFVRPLRSAGYSVVSFDQVGHGRSTGTHATLAGFSRRVAAVAKHYGGAHAVIGHSMGGLAAVNALNFGLQPERLVLIAAPTDPLRMMEFITRRAGFSQRGHAAYLKHIESVAQARLHDLRLTEVAARHHVPLLAIYDDHDEDILPINRDTVQSAWRGAQVVRTQKLGHRRIVRDPKVIAQVVAFVNGTEQHESKSVSAGPI